MKLSEIKRIITFKPFIYKINSFTNDYFGITFKFENQYGASIINVKDGLELTVINFNLKNDRNVEMEYSIDLETPIKVKTKVTTKNELIRLLKQIKSFEPKQLVI